MQAGGREQGMEIRLAFIVIWGWDWSDSSLTWAEACELDLLLAPKEGALGFHTRLARYGAEGRGTEELESCLQSSIKHGVDSFLQCKAVLSGKSRVFWVGALCPADELTDFPLTSCYLFPVGSCLYLSLRRNIS